MNYYFSKTLETSFDEAVQKTVEALKTEGFGVISEINIHEKLKEKLNVDFRQYKILGACNPTYAYKALQAEDKIGTMLPCNVIIQELSENRVEVAAVNPAASMMAIQNQELENIASVITGKIQNVIGIL
jgi:uncharacterized protein (DUF302 family)